MHAPVLLMLVVALGLAGQAHAAATHRFTPSQRYAGCLFGEAVPLMRRGTAREQALSIASDRCIALSTGLTAEDIRGVDLDIHRAIERVERQGL